MLIKKPFKKGFGFSGAPYYATAAAPSTTTLNPSDKAANITLSGGNLTASNSAFAFANVRAIASHSTGKFYYELTENVSAYGDDSFGIANATEVLSANFCGSSANSCGFKWQGSSVFLNNASIGAAVGWSGSDPNTFGCAVDLTAQLIWFRVCSGGANNWNNSGTANPATGVGGFSIGGLNAGPYFPMITLAQTTDNYTANFGASSYTLAAPAGFGNW